ncbi:GLPGLI family protein [Chryseobacterium indoltheticum]|uniref:GLPGLI family protein n=1 Tax=Chryseobacterium indoltheticum TaxID=254 RepID=A0A381FBF9_9FLAO|nr:GLPGLI family protein [Chryseobacterium indoltheticum]SUX43909.1 GLPGLI family protein [Chryseobacterium indoltheticum]
MKLIVIFFLFYFSSFYGQSHIRFIYEYKIVKDSSKKNDITKKIMYLDISDNVSMFYDNEEYQNDSILTAINEISSMNSDKVLKKYPSYSISLISSLQGNSYQVSDDRLQKWKITDEKAVMLNYQAQKAEINFGGRKWIAWFSSEIPIPDGPYKFHGLPGLIIKIEDLSSSHSFKLIAVEKKYCERKFNFKNSIAINYIKFKKLNKEYRENPLKNLMNVEVISTQDGLDNNEFKKKMLKYKKDKILRNNNVIELDLIK